MGGDGIEPPTPGFSVLSAATMCNQPPRPGSLSVDSRSRLTPLWAGSREYDQGVSAGGGPPAGGVEPSIGPTVSPARVRRIKRQSSARGRADSPAGRIPCATSFRRLRSRLSTRRQRSCSSYGDKLSCSSVQTAAFTTVSRPVTVAGQRANDRSGSTMSFESGDQGGRLFPPMICVRAIRRSPPGRGLGVPAAPSSVSVSRYAYCQ